MIIAFDFDGTITKRNTYPTCTEIREGIKQCINKLFDEGHSIMIFTCRDAAHFTQIPAYLNMIQYLSEHGINYHIINKNVTPSISFNPTKPYWNILIDDSALGFNDDWTGEDIYNLIKKQLKL